MYSAHDNEYLTPTTSQITPTHTKAIASAPVSKNTTENSVLTYKIIAHSEISVLLNENE